MRRATYLLHGCTVIFLVALGGLWFIPSLRSVNWDYRVGEEASERNERSTPRSFILPATPAVAEEQEEQARELTDGVDTFGCLRTLRALGYEADDAPPALRARNVDAIFHFQREHGMNATGQLDPHTAKALGCQ